MLEKWFVKEAMKEVFKILLSNLDDEVQLKKQFVLYLSKLKADLYSGKRDDLLVISQKVDSLDGYKSEPAHVRAAKKLDAIGKFEPGMNVEFIQDSLGEVILYGIEKTKVSKRTYDNYWRNHVGKWILKIAGRDIASAKALDFGVARPAQSL
jgi:DNA polymerase elongation subunit (family B)